MKRLFFLIVILGIPCLTIAQYTEWHVSVNGLSTGNGSENSPWDLQTALSQPNTIVKPGDTVWLHGGVYLGRFSSSLNGSSDKFITVSSYPGEWAVIDGNINPMIGSEMYNPINPCDNSTGRGIYGVEDDDEYIMTIDDVEDLSFYSESRLANQNYVLKVTKGYVVYRDFEVSFRGNFTRINDLCNTSNGFEDISGIDHSPVSTSNNKCLFVNLVVRNIPGSGIGSWKYTEDSEIYGCVISNNGFILYNDANCNSTTNSFRVFGKGPGIYTQNASETLTRKINNNFIVNNYDSGVLVWSSSTAPSFDYIQNYNLSDNIFLNNGNPGRAHPVNVASFGGDSKPNLVIDSYTGNSFSHPENINVQDNVFYINSRSSYISGVRVGNSVNVDIAKNHFYKGTAFGTFLNNNYDLTVKNNFYLGKRIQVYTQPNTYGNNLWNFNDNTWYSRDNDGSIPSYTKCYQDNLNARRTIAEFSSLYPPQSDQNSFSYRAQSLNAFNRRCLKPYDTGNSPMFAEVNKIVQNQYDPNKFYVTLNNPTLSSNRNVFFNDFNIPQNQWYTIRDPQNYFNIIAFGAYDTAYGINLPLNLTAFDLPLGFADHCTEHTFAELSTFIVEFGCRSLDYDRTYSNYTEIYVREYTAKNNIVLGANYIANNTADVVAKANKSIKVLPNSHFVFGSKVHLKIENVCPDLPYVIAGNSSRESNTFTKDVELTKSEPIELIAISPNPSFGIFLIESLDDLDINNVTINEINSAKIVYKKNYDNSKTVEVNISNCPKGLYSVRVTLSNKQTITKVVIKG